LGIGTKSNPKKISKDAKERESDRYKIHLSGQLLRDDGEIDHEWFAFGQSLGDGSSWPSNLVSLHDPVTVLKQPDITAEYDESTSVLSANWSSVRNAVAYTVIVNLELKDGAKSSFVKKPTGTNVAVDMCKEISDWDKIINSVLSIIISICSNGGGMFINSRNSYFKISRLSPPSGVSFSATDPELTVTWNNASTAGVKIVVSYHGQYGLVERVVDSEKVSHCTMQKKFLLYHTSILQYKTVEVNLISKKAGCLSSYPAVKQASIQTQTVSESNASFDTAGGEFFDDTTDDMAAEIVGISQLMIFYDSSVRGIETSYYLANGLSHSSPLHGTSAGNYRSLVFHKQESIVAISAMSSSKTKLSQLIIVTQKVDGSYKQHGPYGTAVPSNPEHIKFSGNLLAFKGTCDNSFIYALGFKFTFTYPIILASKMFGGNKGSSYDEHTLTHIPRVVSIKSIYLTHTLQHITSIQSAYILQNGEIWKAPSHGIQKHVSANLQFEDGESVIQIKGTTFFDQNLQQPSYIIKQLSFRTQKKDGTFKWYGPYGAEGGSPFVITGSILGFYGRTGWFEDSLGFYHSLQRSELSGGSNGIAFDVDNIADIAGIKSLKVHSSSRIESVEVTYFNTEGKTLDTQKHGSYSGEGNISLIDFEEDEEIIQIQIGSYKDHFLQKPDFIIGRLQLVTQKKDGSKMQYGPYGCHSVKEFTLNGRVVAFFGRCGQHLDAIGMYYIPI